jgi:DNA-binding response OmpR family regulator
MQTSVKNILILEDDQTYKSIWEHILKRIGHDFICDWAASVEEAKETLATAKQAQKGYDLVVADIFIKGVSTGLDFWLAHETEFRHKAIIVSSVDPRKLDHFLHGRDYYPFYFKKPLNILECAETVQWIFRNPGPKLYSPYSSRPE